MNQDDIYNNVVRIVSKHAKDPAALSAIHPDTHILKDLKVNSARLVDIVLDFEDTFDLEISDDDADRIATIGDAAMLVKALKN